MDPSVFQNITALGLLGLFGWYLLARLGPRMIDRFSAALDQNTKALTDHTKEVREWAKEGRHIQQKTAETLDGITRELTRHHMQEEQKSDRLLGALENLQNKRDP